MDNTIRSFLADQPFYQALSDGKYALLTLLSSAANSRARWKQVFGTALNLDKPEGFNQKLMWLKIHAYNQSPAVKRLSHKVLSRAYVAEKSCEKLLIDQYGVWDHIDDIPWETLPDSFILKTAMGCGSHVLCRDKSVLDIPAAKKTLARAWSDKQWLLFSEMQYKPDKHVYQQVLCERLLALGGKAYPEDYKIYCYGGKPLFILYCFERDAHGHAKFMILDTDWHYLPALTYGRYEVVPPPPACLPAMLDAARALSSTFPFVRVDLYEENGVPRFGELTFTPSGALDPDYTPEGERVLGEPLDISHIDYEALK